MTTMSTASKKKKRDDFHLGKILGEGSYSTVVLAKENATGKEYAMKVLRKQHIIREKKIPYVTREKEILAMTNHPFIVRLYFTFQDKENLYYGLSYAGKGELLQYIIKLGSFDDECSRHYTAEIICAIEYLHKIGVIHRDLKPENILLSDDMHIKLADFGTAKLLKERNADPEASDTRARSFVGTAQYVSPELLTEKVCYKSSDLWAVGCILYQLLAGRPPFRAPNEYLIFQKITKLEYSYPEGFPDVPKNLVDKLIVLDPKARLGCEEMGGYENLKAHEFFKETNFENLPNIEPPKLKLYLPSNEPGQPGIYEEVDITTLMDDKDDDFDQFLPGGLVDRSSSESSNSTSTSTRSSSKTSNEVSELKKQKETIWHPFVQGHLIIKMGVLDKRKGLFAKRRQFLMTEGPEIYYVDPQAMVLKGKIPWTKELRPEAKNFKIFFVHTPHRTYYLEDPESRAIEWCKAIGEVHKRYFGD